MGGVFDSVRSVRRSTSQRITSACRNFHEIYVCSCLLVTLASQYIDVGTYVFAAVGTACVCVAPSWAHVWRRDAAWTQVFVVVVVVVVVVVLVVVYMLE